MTCCTPPSLAAFAIGFVPPWSKQPAPPLRQRFICSTVKSAAAAAPASRRILERFGELRGYESCDAAAVKLHARRAADPPETMLATADEIDFEIPYQSPLIRISPPTTRPGSI